MMFVRHPAGGIFFFTCAIYAVSPSDHLLEDLGSDVPHVLPKLDPSGLDHEHILVHCRQEGGGGHSSVSCVLAT